MELKAKPIAAVRGRMPQVRRSSGRSADSDVSLADYRPGFMELLPQPGAAIETEAPHFRVGITLLPRFTLSAFAGFRGCASTLKRHWRSKPSKPLLMDVGRWRLS